MDDEKAPMYSESPSDKIEKAKDNLVAPDAEIEKKEYINTQKVNITSTLISKLEPSEPKETFLEYKIPTDVSFLSITGVSVTPERRIPRKKGNMKSPETFPNT